jgi:hypothetical protein
MYIKQRMKDFIYKILSSGITGNLSSKRVLTVCSGFTIVIAAYLNMIYKLHIDDNILECLKWITGGGLVTIASEQFAPKNNNENKD